MKQTLLAVLLIFSFAAQAQEITFKETKHNFGKIKESDGPVTHVFTFKNTGNKPLILQQVSASCGCTTPSWTKAPINPGKSGTIKAEFNPAGRNGSFNKNIRISSNATNTNPALYIVGTIEKKPPSLKDYYRQEMGKLNFRSTYAAFTKIKDSEVQTREIELVNLSEQPVTIAAKDVPPHIRVNFQQKTIRPKQKSKIEITLDATKAKQYGYSMNYIYLLIDGESNSRYRFMVSSNVKEDFSSWSKKELANAPKATFKNAKIKNLANGGKRVTVDHNFGTIKTGEKVKHIFHFQNTGKTDLVIRRTKASCGCTAIAPSQTIIKPGEKAEITAIFDSRGRKGPQSKTITVTVNDPEAPSVKLYLRGEVAQ